MIIIISTSLRGIGDINRHNISECFDENNNSGNHVEELNHLTQERREEVQEGTAIYTHTCRRISLGNLAALSYLYHFIKGYQGHNKVSTILTHVMVYQIFLDYFQEGTRQIAIASQNKTLMIYFSPIH